MPGFWSMPIRAGTIFKTGIILLAIFVASVCALGAFIFFSMKPPKERKLIESFHSQRAAYERLRDMLLADQNLRAVYARSGVETETSGLPHKPSEVNFPGSRYNDYVALLQQIGSNAAFRTEGDQPELICVGAWAAGWAADTRHIWVCSTDREPPNQVANLDDYYQNRTRPRDVFRHIDRNWYLRADW